MSKVKDVMTKSVETVTPETPLSEAAAKMKSLDIGSLPVASENEVKGIVTDRDIVVRALAEGLDPLMTTVGQVMTGNIVSCFDDQDISDAAKIMERHQIRRLLVMNRNNVAVGFLSLGDIAIRLHNDKLSGQLLHDISEAAA